MELSLLRVALVRVVDLLILVEQLLPAIAADKPHSLTFDNRFGAKWLRMSAMPCATHMHLTSVREL